MKAAVSGIGTWYPAEVRYNGDWPESFGQRHAGDRTFNDIPLPLGDAAALAEHYLAQEATDPFLGVQERRIAGTTTSAEAEYRAALAALADARIDPADVDVVISYTTVPDRVVPPTACRVADRLGATHACTFGIDSACAALITQLMTASGMVEAGIARHVLLTQSHLLLRAMPLLHPATPGLGDAATACVVSRGGRWPLLALHAVTHGEYYDAVTWVRDEGEDRETPWWKCGGDFRLGSHNRPQAKQLMRDTVQFGAQTVVEALAKAGLRASDISHLFCVQPRGWIPGAIARQLGLAERSAVTTYAQYAHLGACGPIANWHAAYTGGLLDEASALALYAQGAGFTRGAAVLGRA